MPGGFLDTSERGLKFMADADFYPLAERVSEEFNHRSFVKDCRDEINQRVAAYERYASTEPKELKSLAQGAEIGPGELLKVDTDLYKNVSKTWLDPFKAGPSFFHAGWEKQQGGVA